MKTKKNWILSNGLYNWAYWWVIGVVGVWRFFTLNVANIGILVNKALPLSTSIIVAIVLTSKLKAKNKSN